MPACDFARLHLHRSPNGDKKTCRKKKREPSTAKELHKPRGSFPPP